MTMNTLSRLVLAIAGLICVQTGFAQSSPYASADRAVQISEVRRANAALMHHFTWNSRVDVLVDGQVKDIRIEQVQYGPFGQLQHVLLNDQPAAGAPGILPFGFLRRAIAQQQKQQMETFLTGLKQMLQQYTLPTTGKILDFMASATPAGPNAYGLYTLSGNNVVQPGDNLTIAVDPWTRHVRRVTVSTTFQGDAVQLDATFQTLHQSGLNYCAFAEATVPAKQLSVQMQNYNYARLAY
jgi:hypothetical protein